jgi:YesN/AraC family two-component response regulator
MKILIKNMVSTRCIMAVKSILEDLNIPYSSLELGEVETTENISKDVLKLFGDKLQQVSLELKEDKKTALVERIKSAINELVSKSDDQNKVTLSDYLSQKLNYNCTYLSNLFSENQGTSIEKYFILNKVEHVKKLLVNDGLNLKEISYMTSYSSVAHLSYQFKKTTGIAPSQYRYLQNKSRSESNQISY